MATAEDQRASSPPPGGANSLSPQRARLFLMINSFETGGSERQFALLTKSLDSARFSLDLGCIQTKGPLRELFDEVARFRLGGSVYGWKSWHSRWQLSRHLERKKIQIAHAFDFYTNLTLLPAARWAGIPVVIGSQRQLGDLLSRGQSMLQRAAFRLSDCIVCNSRAARERLIEDGIPERKVRVIGNALAPELFSPAAPLVPRSPGILRVGMIARMNSRYKNHRGFLGAAAKIHSRLPGAEFLLAGDGPLRQELEAEAEALGISRVVRFVGDQRDVPSLLASLDLTLAPSDSESLSNVILESMAAGIPVVATQVGGNRELVSPERGILIPPSDVDALAEAALQLLEDKGRRQQLGTNARQFVSANFSLESVTRQYQELYEGLLSEKLERPGYVRNPGPPGSRLRVAMVAPSLRYVGGQSVQADLLLRHWDGDADLEASFIAVDPEFPRGLGWVRRIPGLRTLVRTPIYLAGLWRGLGEVEIAHIFSASYSSFLVAPVPAWLVARMRRKKVLINYHSGEARDHLRSSRLARSVLQRADRLITPSGYLVDVFREFGLRADPVANMADLAQFCYRERRPVRPHLICSRGFHRYYCIDQVVEAFSEVRRVFPDAVLDLVGGGSLEPEIRRRVSELKLSGVNFCGVVSRKEIGKYYDRADIFINASRLDNMPVSVLEAFASGTPVVTTAPEGMRYLVEHGRTGLLSKPGDPGELARNVLAVLEDPQLARHLAANALAELRRYRWDSVREEWLRVYRGLTPERLLVESESVVNA